MHRSATLDPSTAPELALGTPVRLIPAAPALWRVRDLGGRIIGHVQAHDVDGGTRYLARRFHAGSRSFRDVGEFWSADDAVDCLRYAS